MVWRLWGRGPPVILLHGGAGAWSHWVRNLQALSAQHTVIAPDLPGLGDSASPPFPYSPESIADIVAEGIERHIDTFARCSISRQFCMCGFSFGGMICGLTAERVARRVAKIVLIGASGLGGKFNSLVPIARLPSDASASELDKIHRKNLEIMMLHDPRSVDELALSIQRKNAPRTRIMSPEHALTAKLADSLRRSGLPFDSIWGDHCIFSDDLERRRALLADINPAGSFNLVPSAGHWAQYEQSNVVDQLLLRSFDGFVGS